MIETTIKTGTIMSLPELAKRVRRPETTLRIILSRPEFSRFYSGRKLIVNIAFCYHLYNFFECRKAKCHNIRSLERTQKLILKLRKEL